MKKLVIFDVDGVLLLSMDRSVALLCQTIKNAGLELNFQIIQDNLGYSFQEVLIPRLAEAGNWSESQAQLISEKDEYFFRNTKFNSPANLPVRLEELKKAGYSLGVATNRDDYLLRRAFSDIGIDVELFDFIKTCEDGIKKPDSRVFDEALKMFEAEEIIFVGDSPICDLPAAYGGKNKIDFAAITSTIYQKEVFLEAGVPETLIYKSVIDFIDELLVV